MSLALTFYSVVVGLHVVAAVSFLGAAGAFSVIGPMMRDNPQHAPFGLRVMKRVYEVAILPGAAIILATGIYQTIEGGWDEAAWLGVSAGLFVVQLFTGLAVVYPAIKTAIAELDKKGDTPGPPSETFMNSVKKLRTLGPMMGISMIIITFLMVTKPF
ncbi:MAG: DUF2269 family protein [Solirubrobacterales bacterium]